MRDVQAVAPAVPAVRAGRKLATAGVLIGLALGAMEATVVSPAMPNIIATLEGVELYFLVTAAFMVAATATTPVWGRLVDLYGRRRFYLLGILIFLAGSGLSGLATSMTQLVLFRGIQGLGAGALLPVSFTMIADLYPLEERPKTQAMVAGVWGLAGLLGPPLGGLITQYLGWRWVFLVNLPIGFLAAAIVQAAWREPALDRTNRRVDIPGAILTLLASGSFMVGCALVNLRSRPALIAASFAAAAVGAVVLLACERRSSDPFLRLELLSNRLCLVAVLCSALAAVTLFCTTTFITLHLQAVVGLSDMESGFMLLPMTLGWVAMSGLASQISLRVGYRWPAVFGMVCVSAAYALFRLHDPHGTWRGMILPMGLLGTGLGCVLTPLLIAIQNAVPQEKLGAATSLMHFSRSMLGSMGVAVTGVILTAGMAPLLPPGIGPDDLLNRAKRELLAPDVLASVRDAVAAGFHDAFLVGLAAAGVGLALSLILPGGSARRLAAGARTPGSPPR